MPIERGLQGKINKFAEIGTDTAPKAHCAVPSTALARFVTRKTTEIDVISVN